MNKRGKRILVMVLVFAILCTSLPCTPTIPVHAAQTGKNGSWYEVDSRINASWGGHIAGEITVSNVSSQTRQDWQIAFPWQAKISSMWNGSYEGTENGYLITPMEYNRELAPGASVSVGFLAEGEDSELKRLAEEAFFQEEGASITDAEERENMTPAPSVDVAVSPSVEPAVSPSAEPTVSPSGEPTAAPTEEPTASPTVEPPVSPTAEPTAKPTAEPTASPTVKPTASPTAEPTVKPTAEPIVSPTAEPTAEPTAKPTAEPIVSPTAESTVSPTMEPTASPTIEPTAAPTLEPTASPTIEPTAEPTAIPTAEDLYIYTDTTISEDLVCGNLFLIGGSLECNGHSITVQKDYFQNGGRCSLSGTGLSVAGDVHIASGSLSAKENSVICIEGDFITRDADDIVLQDSAVEIGGDLDCHLRSELCQHNGSMEIGGNLTVRQGEYECYGSMEGRVGGDIRILETGQLYFCLDSGEGMEVAGDVLVDSRESSRWWRGKLAVHGNLTQTEEAAEDSLAIAGGYYDNFVLEFCGEDRQRIDIAHPETTTLGTLDLRKSPGVEIPDTICGRQIWGFDRIGKKESLHLELAEMKMVQDEAINSDRVEWKGSLEGDGYDLTVNGDLSMYGNGSLWLQNGKLRVGDLSLKGMGSVWLDREETMISGDLEYDSWGDLSQYSGTMQVGGNLTVRQGKYECYGSMEGRVGGDIRILETGQLYFCMNRGEGMEVAGNVLVGSRKNSRWRCGRLAVHGNLTQTEEAAEDSLAIAGDYYDENFVLEFCGEDRQRIDIAHPETTTLGTLDLRKSPGVETPDTICGKQVWGLDRIVKKESLHLELAEMKMVQDEAINCDRVEWKGNLEGDGYDLTVNGDLSMYGNGSLWLQNGKLQTGDLILKGMGSVRLDSEETMISGDLEYNSWGDLSQYSGTMQVGGNLTVRQGKYECYGSMEGRVDGDIRILETGQLYFCMNRGEGMEVAGNVLVGSRKNSRWRCGRLAVHGNLTQTEEAAEDSLVIENNFSLACCGNKMQTIDLPEVDEIPNLDLSQSTAVCLENDYEGSHLYGLEKIIPKNGVLYSYYDLNTVTADTVLNVDFNCGGELDIGDHKLTVNGNFRQKGRVLVEKGKFIVRDNYTAIKESLWITGGFVHVGGNMSIRQDAGLHFNGDPDSYLCVDGNLSTASGNEADNRFASGTLEIKGNLTQQPSAGSKSIYMDTTKLVLSGDQRQVVTLQDVAGESYLHDVDLSGSLGVKFTCVELKAGSITGMEHITNELLTIRDSRLTLRQDETFYGELILMNSYLDCNGYRLHTGGALTQNDSVVNLDRGALHVDKDYNILGKSILQMICYEDRVYVGGTFATASSFNHSSMLCAGRMEIMGDFDQSGDPNSFTSSELFTMAFLGSGTHQAHFMEKKEEDKYFANLDPYFNDVKYVTDSIAVTTAVIHIGIGMAEGLAEAFLDPAMAVIAGMLLAAYGISAVVLSVDTLLKAAEFVTLIITVLSVYSMLKAGDELGDALNGDYSEKEKAELFGKAAVMMILSAVGLYGSLNVVLQPGMLRSIVTESKSAIGQTFANMKSLVQISYIQDVDSMLLYCEEFVSGPALQTLKEAVKGCNVKQLHEMAKMIREAKNAVGRILKEDELVVAVNNWRENGSITKAVQAVVDWVELGINNGSKYIKEDLIQYVKDIRIKMPNSTLRKGGNVAVADVNIPEIKSRFVAHSKINSKLDKGANITDFSLLKSENERCFTSYVKDGGYSRYHDTEAKILEDIASQISDFSISGTVDLYTELPCCQSCSNIILEFRRKFPNIKLNIYIQ